MEAVIAENLMKIYNGKTLAIDDLSFTIRKGEVYGLLGPNGAGKSTLVKLITGILKPTSGSLVVLNHEIPSRIREVRNKIGYVPQELVFYDHLTVYENLVLFAKSYDIREKEKRINEVLDLIGLHESTSKKSENLSGGQKRRLNLGLGMLHSPELLILDEPSAGMDPQSRNILWDTIEELSNGEITIILTTHLMETADRLSDRVAIIDNGILKITDTPSNLKKLYGKGDLIEIKFYDDIEDNIINRSIELIKPSYNATRYDHSIAVSTLDGINELPDLITTIREKIGRDKIKQISMRDNTLEDVFIQLTGHQLRE